MYTQRYSQGRNDCVIVSVANYFNFSYESVVSACNSFGVTTEMIARRGVSSPEIDKLLQRLFPFGIVQRKRTIRRGAENLSGLARWHKAGCRQGHMNVIIRGIVYDTDGCRYTLRQYRAKSYHISDVWRIL